MNKQENEKIKKEFTKLNNKLQEKSNILLTKKNELQNQIKRLKSTKKE